MSDVRILHCSSSLENYNACLKHKVAGFTTRSPKRGDIIYVAVRTPVGLLCGARMILGLETDQKPWRDSGRYPVAFRAEEITYAEPFDISFLREIGGPSWNLRFLQRSKPIRDSAAITRLSQEFDTRIISEPIIMPAETDDLLSDTEETGESEESLDEHDLDRPTIMGTFQVVPFSTETDPIRGLESLVNNNFHSLFPQFSPDLSILIPENRMFSTRVSEQSKERVIGVNGIPDGILITFNKDDETPLCLSLLEYECFGEKKTALSTRTKYLNESVIPQLLRFASAFSCVTDQSTRSRTIQDWSNRIYTFISENNELHARMINWVRTLNPKVRESDLALYFQKELHKAFERNVRVLLVIDELGGEHKETIRNIIRSFRLPGDGGPPVDFNTYIVRLVQRVNILNNDLEYGLIFQS